MKFLIFLIVLFLAGCGATPYQPSGLSGGYKEFPLEEKNTFHVRFSGNGNIKADVVYDYALLRSALLTKENGYNFFEIIRNDTDIKTVNVGTGATVIYSYKPTAWMVIKMLPSGDLHTNRTFEAEKLIKEITSKYNISEF